MRYALPIWHCLDYDTQVKLALLLNDPHSIPPPVLTEWTPPLRRLSAIDYQLSPIGIAMAKFNADKFMRQAPSRSRG